MDTRIVREILKKNEQFLRRHLVLSRTVLDKLHQQGLIADITRRKIMVRVVVIFLGILNKRHNGK